MLRRSDPRTGARQSSDCRHVKDEAEKSDSDSDSNGSTASLTSVAEIDLVLPTATVCNSRTRRKAARHSRKPRTTTKARLDLGTYAVIVAALVIQSSICCSAVSCIRTAVPSLHHVPITLLTHTSWPQRDTRTLLADVCDKERFNCDHIAGAALCYE